VIDKLEFLLPSAGETHFGRTADIYGMTPPAQSAGIKHVEDEFGVLAAKRGSRFQSERGPCWETARRCASATAPLARIIERVALGVASTTFRRPSSQANLLTTDYSAWATNCQGDKVTAVQVSPSNEPSEWQPRYREQADHSRRIASAVFAAE
jgi:predicted molibdopterin-dependent oxidoreductase YjgC